MEKQLKPLRLAKVIKNLLNETKSVHTLARKIEDANDKAKTGCNVSWRTLEKLANNPETVRLTWGNLVALDAYLRWRNESLDEKPILDSVGILNSLASPSKKVVFLVGAKPRPQDKTCDLSPWDMRSTTQLARDLTLSNPGVAHEIVDIILGPHADEASLRGKPWLELFQDPELSIVAIGSPRACLAAEFMMSRQFRLNAFGTAKLGEDLRARLPFHFIWPPEERQDFRSRFALPPEQLPASKRELKRNVCARRASGFRLRGRYHQVLLREHEWIQHGVVTAQRRANGQVWLVVSGLTGPATYAAAMKVHEIRQAIPWTPEGRDGPVLWVAVESRIREIRSAESEGDDRKVVSARVLHPARPWEPV